MRGEPPAMADSRGAIRQPCCTTIGGLIAGQPCRRFRWRASLKLRRWRVSAADRRCAPVLRRCPGHLHGQSVRGKAISRANGRGGRDCSGNDGRAGCGAAGRGGTTANGGLGITGNAHAGRRSPDACLCPALVGFELALAGDGRGRRAGVAMELKDHQTEGRVQPQGWIGDGRSRNRLLRHRRLKIRGSPRFRGIAANGNGLDGLDPDVIWHVERTR